MKHYVPHSFVEFVNEHPQLSSDELFKLGVATSPRTARRWKQYVLEDRAKPDYSRAHSAQMLQWEDEQDDNKLSISDIIDLSRKQAAYKQSRDPIFITDDLTFEDEGPVSIIFVSCAHLGGRYTAYDEFGQIFDAAKEIPHLYWASLGDDIEGFLPQFRDKKAVIDQVWDINTQFNIIADILTQLKDSGKLLFGMGSQHGGKWLNQDTGRNPIKQAYIDLGVPYYDGMAYLKLHVGLQTYNIAVAHQFPGDSMWNPLHPQTRAFYMQFPNADMVVCGDKHKFAWAELPAHEWEAMVGNRASNRVLLLQVGTAKTGPDPHTIERWPQGELGWPIVTFFPNKHFIKWTWDIGEI